MIGEVGIRLLGNIENVSYHPMVYQGDSLLSLTRASPAPLGASDSDAAGGAHKKSRLERLKIIGSNPWNSTGIFIVVVDVFKAWRLAATRWART